MRMGWEEKLPACLRHRLLLLISLLLLMRTFQSNLDLHQVRFPAKRKTYTNDYQQATRLYDSRCCSSGKLHRAVGIQEKNNSIKNKNKRSSQKKVTQSSSFTINRISDFVHHMKICIAYGGKCTFYQARDEGGRDQRLFHRNWGLTPSEKCKLTTKGRRHTSCIYDE